MRERKVDERTNQMRERECVYERQKKLINWFEESEFVSILSEITQGASSNWDFA